MYYHTRHFVCLFVCNPSEPSPGWSQTDCTTQAGLEFMKFFCLDFQHWGGSHVSLLPASQFLCLLPGNAASSVLRLGLLPLQRSRPHLPPPCLVTVALCPLLPSEYSLVSRPVRQPSPCLYTFPLPVWITSSWPMSCREIPSLYHPVPSSVSCIKHHFSF